jgi:hypothetical protein
MFALSIFVIPDIISAQPTGSRTDGISGGAEAAGLAGMADLSRIKGSPISGIGAAFTPGVGFLGYNFDDNGTETGFVFIPPDPIGAAGTDRLISVVNVGIECRNKSGTLLWRDSLKDFFTVTGLTTLGTFTFDPKVVYDHYENRFVVVTLERLLTSQGDPTDDSRILVAVSKTASPASATSADWWYLSINSKINIGGNDHWADYPGFEVDEEAVYITNNMFPFSTGSGGVRLWIIDKGVVGGFYAGATASWNVYNPIPTGFFNVTTQPALVYGAGGAGLNIGTYLVGYSSITYGGPGANEAVQIIRVDNPLGTPSFTGQFVDVGDLEDVGGIYGFPAIPDAPQSGSTSLIEVNDARALDAVWRNNELWVTTTINPNTANDATNSGQATAHWFRFDTSVPATITVADQGNIGGEDIATATWTFFPAVAVNGAGDAQFGFSASASSIFCGAYYAGRHPSDASGTVQTAGTVKVGVDYYLRTFGSGRNRWGDYSGACVDPSDDNTFWIYNEYAEQRGSGTVPEDGRWGTAWRSLAPQQATDFGDAPDQPYPTLLANNGARHNIVAGATMGALIDAEPDGQPHPNALGDDLAVSPDEDGVNWNTPLVQGQPASLTVTVTVGGWLDAWIDFNGNGSWLDPGEKIYAGVVVAGPNLINYNVPASAVLGPTYARFRYNLGGLVLTPTGPAPDGEVEDYEVVIEESQEQFDFGDAPDGPYPTLLGSSGAHHLIVQGINMGTLIDAEVDGQPTAAALGDDTTNQPDEDGVAFPMPFIPGFPTQVDVTVTQPGFLDVWFDWNLNGSWADGLDHVYSGPVNPGLNPIMVPVPPGALAGQTFARFRYNTGGPLPFTGFAPDGEVEDYAVDVEQVDFGDAPDPTYPTLIASNGAQHGVWANIYMGMLIDGEPDGLPDPNALGDDANNQPDEDGVVFTSLLDPTQVATVDVTASVAGFLDAWIDFDSSGTWDAADQIFSSQPLAPGLNSLVFNVPATGKHKPGFPTFARFRFSTGGGLPPDGPAYDGEVEDYLVQIEPDVVTDAGTTPLPTRYALHDAVPNPFNPQTTLSFSLPEAGHVKLTVYDVGGRLVATLLDEERNAGVWNVVWQGLDSRGQRVSSGVYFYRIEAGEFVETKRMVLLK